MKVQCPHCGKRMTIKSKVIPGKEYRFKCPGCNEVITRTIQDEKDPLDELLDLHDNTTDKQRADAIKALIYNHKGLSIEDIAGFLFLKEEEVQEILQKGIEGVKRGVSVTEDSTVDVPGQEELALHLGYGLVYLVNDEGSDFVESFSSLRKRFMEEQGWAFGPVSIKDSLLLMPNEYAILVKGKEVARRTVEPGKYIAMASPLTNELAPATTTDATGTMPALWIDHDQMDEYMQAGYTVTALDSDIRVHFENMMLLHGYQFMDVPAINELLTKKGVDLSSLSEDEIVRFIAMVQFMVFENNPLTFLDDIVAAYGIFKDRETVNQRLNGVRQLFVESILEVWASDLSIMHGVPGDELLESISSLPEPVELNSFFYEDGVKEAVELAGKTPWAMPVFIVPDELRLRASLVLRKAMEEPLLVVLAESEVGPEITRTPL